MTTLYVTYAGSHNTPFDREYYVSTHLPMVRDAWGPYGLENVAAFFPGGDGGELIAVAVCRFRDEAAMQACFAAPKTPAVMADVKEFTDVVPTRSLAVPM